VAEQLVTVKNKRGFQRLEWQKLRERNEALDARVYARAAAWIIGVDRWSDDRWRSLESELRDAAIVGQVSKNLSTSIRNQNARSGTEARDQVWISRRKAWLR
jgi:phage terminase large subunit GpA-like protein